MRVLILDSARGKRHLDATESQPWSLVSVVDAPVLQWLNRALKVHSIDDVTYVGGYHIEKVINNFPGYRYHFHENWQFEGELAAFLRVAPVDNCDCLIIRGSTLVLPDAVESITKADADVAYGTYDSGNGAIGFAGIVFLKASQVGEVLSVCRTTVAQDPLSGLEALLPALDSVSAVHIDGTAAPVIDSDAVRRIVFRGKAKTLEQLARLAKRARVLDQVRFLAAEWTGNSLSVVARIKSVFPEGRLIVRSSAASEDTLESSAAGRFHSQLDVPAGDNGAVSAAIEQVVESFRRNGRELQSLDEVLVQPQVQKLAMSGVMLTRDLNTGAPYFVINVESGSGRSDVVTSGADGDIESHYVAWDADVTGRIAAVIELGRELIDLTQHDSLDVEFGEDQHGQLYLFQVRPMSSTVARMQIVDSDHLNFVKEAKKFVAAQMAPKDWIAGSTTIFGNMSDWNPAEMIGAAPRPLALSLYQRLIGDRSWARARATIGYRDVEPVPLILSIGGRPYVDVRASLNSFLPADLDEEITGRWVDYGLNQLRSDRSLHDKIEFDIALTCLAPDWPQQSTKLVDAGLSRAEVGRFQDSVRRLTQAIVGETAVSFTSLETEVEKLRDRRKRYDIMPGEEIASVATKVRMLLSDCERYGVVPFSILARYGFISMAFLRGFRDLGILQDDEFELVLRSIPTISTRFVEDVELYARGEMDMNELVTRYGHLRPHSYEITNANYAEDTGVFEMCATADNSARDSSVPWSMAQEIMGRRGREIDRILGNLGLDVRPAQLLDFIRKSIFGREQIKFEFMKNLNGFMRLTEAVGARLGLSRETLSYLKVQEILDLAINSISSATAARLERAAGYRKKRMELTLSLRLPDVITAPHQVQSFVLEAWRPNFISQQKVVAPALHLDSSGRPQSLAGRIVMIRAADPGFDWVFSHPIVGLVTEYGGVASHMAIRAAEFGLPAAIGCGSVIFEKLLKATNVELDCANQQVRAVS